MDKQKHGRPRQSSEDLTYLRKIKKPLVEKRRRERINTSLQQLKQLLIENIKLHGGTQVSKLDKADILELTVSYLRHIQHQQKSVAMATGCSIKQEYSAGYSEAVRETLSFLQSGSPETTYAQSYINSNLNRNSTSAMTSLTSSGHVTASLAPDIELLQGVKQETDNSMFNRDTNGNFTEGFSDPTRENDKVRTSFASQMSRSHGYVENSASLHSDSVSVTESKHYLDCANTYLQAAIDTGCESLALTLDLNGNVNNAQDGVNNNYLISNTRENSNSARAVMVNCVSDAGENSDSARAVMVNCVNDDVTPVCDDVDSDDDVDRLYIHVEDRVEVHDENGNHGHRDNGAEEREEVWRPW